MYYIVADRSTADSLGWCNITAVGTTEDINSVWKELPLEAIAVPTLNTVSTPTGYEYCPSLYPSSFSMNDKYHFDQGRVRLADGRYVRDPVPYVPPVIPADVSKLWLMRALRTAGHESTVLSLLAAPGNEAMQRDFNAAYRIKRTDTMMLGIAAVLGLSTSQIDDLFIVAGHEA